jgi:hypothetical protein
LGNTNAPDGRGHWPYCYTAAVAFAAVRRGALYGKSDEQGSSPVAGPVHPTDLVATVYYELRIGPNAMVLNDLKQPPELVRGRR